MKNRLLYLSVCCMFAMVLGSCKKDKGISPADPNAGQTFSALGDQAARPGVNVVFISPDDKDKFNATAPAAQSGAFLSKIQSKLMALNPNYSTNFLGLTASQFSGVLATDVLNVSTTGATSYYDGTNVLTGRQLGDDVIDFSFKLIWGGPNGTSNPGLTSDHVDHNDKPFLTSFPYEAAPW